MRRWRSVGGELGSDGAVPFLDEAAKGINIDAERCCIFKSLIDLDDPTLRVDGAGAHFNDVLNQIEHHHKLLGIEPTVELMARFLIFAV
jgi:hypothetical protein